jgi:hypothetical protein
MVPENNDGAPATILDEIRELGYVSVRDGSIISEVRPKDCLVSSRWDRWTPTLRYLRDYAQHHPHFGGEFFVCLYDGWREYIEPTFGAARRYTPWLDLPEDERCRDYIGRGKLGEVRFCAQTPHAAAIYPELPHPVLAYNRHVGDRNTLLIPDSEFLETEFAPFRNQVLAADVPFTAKRGDALFWRGSPNTTDGYAYSTPPGGFGVRIHPRRLAVAMSQPEIATALGLGGILNASFAYSPISNMLQNRYLLDIDGMVTAWSGGYWKLLSNSLVIRAPSHWEHWFSSLLHNGATHLELPSWHPNDVRATHAWCQSHPAETAAMAAAGTAVARRVTYRYAVEEYTIA